MTLDDLARYLREQAMADPEFARAMRYFTGILKFEIDGERVAFRFDDGALVAFLDEAPAEADIVVSGTRSHWENMLRKYPEPFYQCLQTTSIKHGLSLNNTSAFYAYLPALNRLVALLRAAYPTPEQSGEKAVA